MYKIRVTGNYKGIKENIERLTGNSNGIINNVQFTTENIKEADGLLTLNEPMEKIVCFANKKLNFAVFQEPGNFFVHPYMYFNTEQYYKVLSPKNFFNKKNIEISHGFLPWHIQTPLEELERLKPVKKSKIISCISSNARRLPGHKIRYNFVEYLKNRLECDFYGKGYKFIEDKNEALRDYKYSIAIENSDNSYGFTEKITDCFLNYTVPIYYGGDNINALFPSESIIKIDLKNKSHEENLKVITETIKNDNYLDRMSALEKSRSLVLKDYNLFYKISEEVNSFYENKNSSTKEKITLKPLNSAVKKILLLLHRSRNVINKIGG